MNRPLISVRGAAIQARRFSTRTGVRLAAVQVLVLLIAFGVAGLVTRSGVRALGEATLRREIQGEMASLQDEIFRFGEGRLATTIDRRTRLWRGFEYGLEGPHQEHLAGTLRLPARREGWVETGQASGSGEPAAYLVYVQPTPLGGELGVGKDLAGMRLEVRLVTDRLIAAAVCGGLLCLAVWALFMRSTWRRLSNMGDVARLVAEGRLNVRVPAAAPSEGADDIDQLAKAFNTMLDRIGGLVGQLQRMTVEVAHDLRTPLTRVQQKLARLEEGSNLGASHQQLVREIRADIWELLRTFDALLQLAEIEGRSLADEGRSFDLADVAQRLADVFRPDIEEGGRRLEVDVTPATVTGDPALVAQMLSNLIENSMRHTPVGTKLSIVVATDRDGARLTVADNGPGVPARLREAVLAPYFRLDRSQGSPGSGVGLAIVAAVAARHGAQLALEDNAPGLRVTAVFPSLAPATADGQAQPRSMNPIGASSPSASRARFQALSRGVLKAR
ncbi:MAG TPA: HAMP domain-containing sensor histidine kinase [Phenylobacterium sp.]|jgi:signal transduction histidine kinase|nr:HAMP domain-containing sensor histidine kinase [Phenylobacterium sp.]